MRALKNLIVYIAVSLIGGAFIVFVVALLATPQF